MKSCTFDWNCVIAAECAEEQGIYIRKLVELHRSGVLDVGITTVSASETLKESKSFPASGKQFRRRISALGWDDLSIVLGPCVVGLSYIGLSKLADETFNNEINALWNVICPGIERKLPTSVSQETLWSPQYKKWRNAWCDVHTLWTHINDDRDIFVTTNTKDFQGNFGELKELGLREVASPNEVLTSTTSRLKR
ncbi:hypothetical protein [Maritimibacter sp. 55A14]|uniref:hypothetical protein n=1 Tax=Maritimibacter sp. 55A14 TaxID=2174844 RepID=UPI0011B22CD3|nr:hypothetical protein [Maritimibacter sp. 55A14]